MFAVAASHPRLTRAQDTELPAFDLSQAQVVVTEAPLSRAPRSSSPMQPALYGEGARIVMLSPGSSPRVFTGDFASAADPEISFDGRRMLFAGRKSRGDNWNIFEMDLETAAARQITRDLGDCRKPVYLNTLFTLDSEKPWHEIAFLAPAVPSRPDSPRSIYAANPDGTHVHRLTFNPHGDRDAAMLPDGRLLFSSWRRATFERGPLGRVSLLAINTDGTDYAPITGDQGGPLQHMACVTPLRLVVFVEADAANADGAGVLASVSLRRNLHSYRKITTPGAGQFYSPSALPDGAVLVSRRSSGAEPYGLYRLDPATGSATPLFAARAGAARYNYIQAKLVAPRPEPDGRSTSVNETDATGQLYALNVYTSEPGRPWVAPGTPLRLRVLEGVSSAAPPARHASSPPCGAGMRACPPGVSETHVIRRFLGEVPIEPDGSFNVYVPANTPVQLQIIDQDGMALRTSEWVWTKNHKAQGCVGCHEDPERTPDNRFVDAIKHPGAQLTLPPERRRIVDFERDVMPVVAGKCGGCHSAGTNFLRLDVKNAAAVYSALTAPARPGAAEGRYVHPGRARTSPLIWHLFGRDTSRPWDGAVGAKGAARLMPPGGAPRLTADERRTFVEWIDLGAAWSGISGAPPDARASAGARRAGSRGGSR